MGTKHLAIFGKCGKIPVNETRCIPEDKITTENEGKSVRVRGPPGGKYYCVKGLFEEIIFQQKVEKLIAKEDIENLETQLSTSKKINRKLKKQISDQEASYEARIAELEELNHLLKDNYERKIANQKEMFEMRMKKQENEMKATTDKVSVMVEKETAHKTKIKLLEEHNQQLVKEYEKNISEQKATFQAKINEQENQISATEAKFMEVNDLNIIYKAKLKEQKEEVEKSEANIN